MLKTVMPDGPATRGAVTSRRITRFATNASGHAKPDTCREVTAARPGAHLQHEVCFSSGEFSLGDLGGTGGAEDARRSAEPVDAWR